VASTNVGDTGANGQIGAKDDLMSEGSSGEAGPEQDPWSSPVDFGQPGPAAPPGGAAGAASAAPPSSWSAPPPTSWSAAPGGYQQPAGQYPPSTAEYPPPPGQYAPPVGQYPPPTGQYPPPSYYPTGPAQRANPVAIAALVCGIGQFVLGLLLVGNILLAIPAIICGAIGLRQVNQRGERGRGMAIAGLVLGILGVVYFLLVIVVIVIGIHARG
jgi:Domain of unknown function (DUF4190)